MPRRCRANSRSPCVRNTAGAGFPPARGQPVTDALLERGVRKIPACARPTRRTSAAAGRSADDPRVRGAERRLLPESRNRPGGSPRARGQRLLSCSHTGWSASFPSVAFRSATESGTKITARVSPRTGTVTTPATHPPTRMIPRRCRANSRSPCVRNTAQAGSRMPGVDSTTPPAEASRSRASPQARGRPVGGEREDDFARRIPAHAGSTTGCRRRTGRCAEDPRARGVNRSARAAISDHSGGSPRTRGQRGGSGARCPSKRRIPAHAGSTAQRRGSPARPSEDPRARGVNQGPQRPPEGRTGGSPRTRGQPLARDLRLRRGRRIPAHAGSTR